MIRNLRGISAVILLVGSMAAGHAAGKQSAELATPFLLAGLNVRGVSFTADGNTAYFPIRVGEGYMQVLCVADRVGGKWSEPRVLPFSGRHIDADPFVSPDGGTLYFASNRTADGGERQDLDIWVVQKKGATWGEPRPLPDVVNRPTSVERSPVLTRSGKLYFTSTRSGGGDIFYAQRGPNGTFAEPVALGPEINSSAPELQVAVSPDEKTLVFAAFRPDEALAPGHPYPRGDLYISHFVNGAWTPARHLDNEVNTVAAEQSPSFSPDGRFFYFVSERGFAMNQDILLTYDALEHGLHSPVNGRGKVYRIAAAALGTTQ